MLNVREHSELLSAQYLVRCLEPENVCHSITTRDPPKRRMKETSGGAVIAVTDCCANCVETSRPQECGP